MDNRIKVLDIASRLALASGKEDLVKETFEVYNQLLERLNESEPSKSYSFEIKERSDQNIDPAYQ